MEITLNNYVSPLLIYQIYHRETERNNIIFQDENIIFTLYENSNKKNNIFSITVHTINKQYLIYLSTLKDYLIVVTSICYKYITNYYSIYVCDCLIDISDISYNIILIYQNDKHNTYFSRFSL